MRNTNKLMPDGLTTTWDAIVLGAGGAGLMCAAAAGQRGSRVIVLDHADKPGKKILISGGGRCNFTNLHTAPDRYLSENPHFAKSALRRYQAQDFIKLVDAYGIAWHEKTLGQLFCDQSARQIVDLLMSECAKGDVAVELGKSIRVIDHRDGLFHVRTDDAVHLAPALVIATGGPSIPKMGATGFAYEVAKQFGLGMVTPRPALVPFTLPANTSPFSGLAGVSARVIAACGKMRFEEAFLITHRGLSGPAILQISSYWRPGQTLTLNLLPHLPTDWLTSAKRRHPKRQFRAVLSEHLPERFAAAIAQHFPDRLGLSAELATLSDKTLANVAAMLNRWPIAPAGTEGYAKAEVTAGGIDTADLSSKTMAAKSIPGLYAIGEAVDVTGWLGGYNFQWAWASGVAAGEAIAAATHGQMSVRN